MNPTLWWTDHGGILGASVLASPEWRFFGMKREAPTATERDSRRSEAAPAPVLTPAKLALDGETLRAVAPREAARREVDRLIKADREPFSRARAAALVAAVPDVGRPPSLRELTEIPVLLVEYERLRGARCAPSREAVSWQARHLDSEIVAAYERARAL